MRKILIHNEHDKVSRDLRDELLAAHPDLEVIDFMRVRESVWFRGAPTIIIAADAEDIAGHICAQRELEEATLAALDEMITKARILSLDVPASATAGVEFVAMVTATDLDGNPASLPEDCIISVNYIDCVPDKLGRVFITSDALGILDIVAYSDFARSSWREVVVDAR